MAPSRALPALEDLSPRIGTRGPTDRDRPRTGAGSTGQALRGAPDRPSAALSWRLCLMKMPGLPQPPGHAHRAAKWTSGAQAVGRKEPEILPPCVGAWPLVFPSQIQFPLLEKQEVGTGGCLTCPGGPFKCSLTRYPTFTMHKSRGALLGVPIHFQSPLCKDPPKASTSLPLSTLR